MIERDALPLGGNAPSARRFGLGEHFRAYVDAGNTAGRILVSEAEGKVSGTAGDIQNLMRLPIRKHGEKLIFPVAVPVEGEKAGDEVVFGSDHGKEPDIVCTFRGGVTQMRASQTPGAFRMRCGIRPIVGRTAGAVGYVSHIRVAAKEF
jgi:hypothetical protein